MSLKNVIIIALILSILVIVLSLSVSFFLIKILYDKKNNKRRLR